MTDQWFINIGEQFVKFYYDTFDTRREHLLPLYGAQSMLTFEGQQFMGPEAVIQKLTGLPFKKVKHVLTTVDCQPTVGNGVVVFVVGQLKADDDPPHSFSETFLLQPADNTGQNYFILNDMFRLSIHN